MENETINLLKACKDLLDKQIQHQEKYAQSIMNIVQTNSDSKEEKDKAYSEAAIEYMTDMMETEITYNNDTYTVSELLSEIEATLDEID